MDTVLQRPEFVFSLNMTGIAVTVASNDLPTLDTLGTEVVVWTHNGKASRDVEFGFASDAKACANKPPAPPAPPKDKPAITRVLPSSISACDPNLAFTVEGRNLWNDIGETTALLGTMRASVEPKGSRDGTVIDVRVDVSDWVRKIGGLDTLSLVLRTAHGVAQGEVRVAFSDACGLASPPSTPEPVISKVLPSTFSTCDEQPTVRSVRKQSRRPRKGDVWNDFSDGPCGTRPDRRQLRNRAYASETDPQNWWAWRRLISLHGRGGVSRAVR